ncbi:MAG: heparan-alpha-glucosaminide N-acetyltransferase domain-containing protein [Usitatibacter sp.]
MKTDRLVSLDAFRGFTVAAMVLVNNPGDWKHLHAPLAHAKWDGWTFTDTIFPAFLFICGVSMMLSLERRTLAGDDQRSQVMALVRRGAIIFAIGLVLNFIPAFDLATVRIPGVLQRIGFCVALAAPIVVVCGWRGQAAATLKLFALYAVVMLLLPVPDVSGRVAAGALEPGRDAGAWLDRLLLQGHLWSASKTWDPEGLLSTLPSLASLLIGALAGRWLLQRREAAGKTVWMMLAGLAFLGAGTVLDAVLMPINKSLWSISYSVFMTGWALLAFSAFYWLIDGNESALLRQRASALALPFTIYGLNALFIFAFSGLIARLLSLADLKRSIYAPFQALPLSAENTSLAFAVTFNLVMLLVAWAMWRKGWFIKI